MEMNYLKEKQKMSIALIVSCAAVVLSLLGVAGGLFQETAFYLHECLAVIVWIGMLIIPLELFIWLRLIRLCKKRRLASEVEILQSVISICRIFAPVYDFFWFCVFHRAYILIWNL